MPANRTSMSPTYPSNSHNSETPISHWNRVYFNAEVAMQHEVAEFEVLAGQWEKMDFAIIMSFWRNVILLLLRFQNYRAGAGEMAPWSRALVVLSEALDSSPSTHMAVHNCLWHQFQGIWSPLLNSAWCTDIHVHRTCFVWYLNPLNQKEYWTSINPSFDYLCNVGQLFCLSMPQFAHL